MAKAKTRIVLVMVLFLAVCWAAMLVGHTESPKQTQARLLAQADDFAADGLYVRAIPLYQEALNYAQEASDQEEIEQRLLQTYSSYGDMASYVQLVEERAAQNRAAAQEYVTAANYYLTMGLSNRALPILAAGIENLGETDGELVRLWEENRYNYRWRNLGYSEILPAGDNGYYPVFNGSLWGYVEENGTVAIDMKYDWISAFDGGYALAQTGGRFYVILEDGSLYSIQDEAMTEGLGIFDGRRVLGKVGETWSYYGIEGEPIAESFQFDAYSMNSEGYAAVCQNGKWALMDDGGNYVTEFIWDGVRLDERGYAVNGGSLVVEKDGACVLVNTDGTEVSGFRFADAKAPGSDEWIAVCDESGRWGFADRTGAIQIECQYEDALSFNSGLAAVKQGGVWGYINASGEMIIEPVYEEAGSFLSGAAIARMNGSAGLLVLDYDGGEEG